MKDYLKELCNRSNVKLVYTSNKSVILSNGTENHIPTIRAHHLFRQCTPKVAEAIVAYYNDVQHQINHLKIIQDYVKELYPEKEYKIKLPDGRSNQLKAKIPTPIAVEENLSSFIELGIASMTQKSFLGMISQVRPDEPLQVSADDIIELDIIVEDPDTYA